MSSNVVLLWHNFLLDIPCEQYPIKLNHLLLAHNASLKKPVASIVAKFVFVVTTMTFCGFKSCPCGLRIVELIPG
jgi:hypothetical protein